MKKLNEDNYCKSLLVIFQFQQLSFCSRSKIFKGTQYITLLSAVVYHWNSSLLSREKNVVFDTKVFRLEVESSKE